MEKLKDTKHEFGSLQKWIVRYKDQLDICDAPQCNVSDKTKCLYFMENLSPKIFEQTLIEWKSTLTRASFPKTYDKIKTHIINDYKVQMTDPERTKVILNVIKYSLKKITNYCCIQTRKKKANVIYVATKNTR